MTKDEFSKEYHLFKELLCKQANDYESDTLPQMLIAEFPILPVKYIRKSNDASLGEHCLIYTMHPHPTYTFEVQFNSQLLYYLHSTKGPEKHWKFIRSKSFEFAQRWNKTVYGLLTDEKKDKNRRLINIFRLYFEYDCKVNPDDYESLLGAWQKSLSHHIGHH